MKELSLKKIQGMSLIEVCIAIAIFSIIVISLTEIFNQGYLAIRKMRMSQTAYFLAQRELENLTLATTDFENANISSPTAFEAPFQDYERTVQIDYPAPNLTEINVTVFWQGRSSERSFTLRTYFADF